MAENNYLIFGSRIREAYGNLAKKERMIADFLLRDPEFLLDASAKDLADATGTSPATVIRFCRTCGFNGLTEMKLSLKRENRTVDSHPSRAVDGALSDNELSALVRERVLGYHNVVVSTLLTDWNIEAYSMAVEAILNAGQIVIVGEGVSRGSCVTLMNSLLVMGLRCHMYLDSVFEIINIDRLAPGDVVIDISFPGSLRTGIDSMKLAKERGAVTIGIVGMQDSPILEYLDIVLTTASPKQEYYHSDLSVRIAELVVIGILTTLLDVKYKERFGEMKAVAPATAIREVEQAPSESTKI